MQAANAGFLSVLSGLAVSFAIIPADIEPIWGWLLTYEWTLLVSACLFGLYLWHLPPVRAPRGCDCDFAREPCTCGCCMRSWRGQLIKSAYTWECSSSSAGERKAGWQEAARLLPLACSTRRRALSKAVRACGYVGLAVGVLGLCPWLPWLLGVKTIVLQVVMTAFSFGAAGGLVLLFVFHRLTELAVQAHPEVCKSIE